MLEYLKQELDRAIKQEKFEHAASLRDRIATLEAKDAAGK
jgi:protein-arginine kinase activator protein McsA